MSTESGRARWLFRFVEYERLLRNSPRWLEIACALPLIVFALMMFYLVVIFLRFQQYYGGTPRAEAYDWTALSFVTLMGTGALGLAVNLARGASRRLDGGLFSPTALRTWGLIFALIPLGLMLITWTAIFHAHLFLLSWGAAVACFVLAARRGLRCETEITQRPIE